MLGWLQMCSSCPVWAAGASLQGTSAQAQWHTCISSSLRIQQPAWAVKTILPIAFWCGCSSHLITANLDALQECKDAHAGHGNYLRKHAAGSTYVGMLTGRNNLGLCACTLLPSWAGEHEAMQTCVCGVMRQQISCHNLDVMSVPVSSTDAW